MNSELFPCILGCGEYYSRRKKISHEKICKFRSSFLQSSSKLIKYDNNLDKNDEEIGIENNDEVIGINSNTRDSTLNHKNNNSFSEITSINDNLKKPTSTWYYMKKNSNNLIKISCSSVIGANYI